MIGLILILLAMAAIAGALGFERRARAALTGAKVLAGFLLVLVGVVALAA